MADKFLDSSDQKSPVTAVAVALAVLTSPTVPTQQDKAKTLLDRGLDEMLAMHPEKKAKAAKPAEEA